ncbi:hypothetical protein A2112_02640 [Candidatus Woesebacteria bacterium GWA1_42_12]|uniref:Uncharacterized protein n=1 Tax=Candidatus Woesebacteria bacterium GWA1_42_12 TaxID=1802472 RepID=A0A1F7WM53_9BACT|nr:MAG: hypothetical protein A2112_02640 [Candidatus Woesebacteria bacterium GWA1_42_12]
MAVEQSVPRGLSISEMLQGSVSNIREGLARSVAGTRKAIMRIVEPPYDTPDGKPLEVRFFEPGKAVFPDTPRARELIKIIKEAEASRAK